MVVEFVGILEREFNFWVRSKLVDPKVDVAWFFVLGKFTDKGILLTHNKLGKFLKIEVRELQVDQRKELYVFIHDFVVER